MTTDTDQVRVSVAARAAGVTPQRVYDWIERGTIVLEQTKPIMMISLTATRARAAALGVTLPPLPGPVVPPEYVWLAVAARTAGVSDNRVRKWVTRGRVATQAATRGRLVRLADVLACAASPEEDAVTPADQDLVSIAEVGRRVGRSRMAVYGWIKKGRVVAVRGDGRGQLLSLAAVHAYLAARQQAEAERAARPKAEPRRRRTEGPIGPTGPTAAERLVEALQAHSAGITAGRLAKEAGVPVRYAHTLLAGAVASGQASLHFSSAGQRLYSPRHLSAERYRPGKASSDGASTIPDAGVPLP